jgi:hypothetical protein
MITTHPGRVSDVDDDDSPFDERGRLKDGRTYRVRMHAKDSVQAAIMADRRSHVTDATGDSGLGLHRPGARFATDASLYDAAMEAYAQATCAAEEAWRKGPGWQDASALGTGYSGREGDPCTVRAGASEGYLEGSPGHLARVDGKLVCVPDKPSRRADSMSIADAEAIKQRAWEDANREAAEAWKHLGQR